MSDYILSQQTYPQPYFMGFVFHSFTAMEEINVPLNSVFNEPFSSRISALFNGSLSGEAINEQLTTSINDLFTEDFLLHRNEDPDFASINQALGSNSVEPWNVTTPTYLIHSTDDELVPIEISSSIYQALLAAGTSNSTLELIAIPGYSHTEGIIPAGLISLQWFLDIKQD